MNSDCDPAAMSPEELLAEVAFHLAAGYLRLLLSRRKALEDRSPPVALMSMVNGQERPRKDGTWNPA